MSNKSYSKVCDAKSNEGKSNEGKSNEGKSNEGKTESSNYVSKKTNRNNDDSKLNNTDDNTNHSNGGNRRYNNDGNSGNGVNRRYNNDNSNSNSNGNSNSNSNSNSNNGNGNGNGNGNRRYNNGNDNGNGGNRRYNNDNNGNGGNRRYNNDSNGSNGGNRRYDNGNGGNRRYNNNNDNDNVNSNDNGGYRQNDNRQSGGNRRYDNRNNGGNRHYNNDNMNNQNDQQSNNSNSNNHSNNHDDDETNNSTTTEAISSEPLPLTADDITRREECMVPIESFDDLSTFIDLKIIRGVMSYGFDVPSPIQQKAIKPFLSKFDLIAQAQSGTGKTATFCIGTLGNIDFTKNETQAIILAHTMELAQQIEHVFANIGKYIDVRLALAVKTMSVRENIDVIMGKNNDGLLPHVIIGTPGRMLDMITKKIININTIKVLVIDEADELLSEGFIVQIKQIISSIGSNTQIGLFSATMDSNFFKLTEKFLRNPINILINKENLTLDGIKQYNIECEKNEWKFDTLCDLYSLFSTSQTIIYCNYHQSVELLTKKLQEQNFKVSLIHGSMDIMEREEAMKKFRSLQTRVLISTDLLGRGIDVQQVSIVINYDIPFKNESYIHRIGRSGRHGRKGTAINFITNNDVRRIEEIAKYYNTSILPLPADLASVFQNDS